SMTVPFGAGQCGSFSEDASGLMDMGKKTSLSFTGEIAMNCGKLEVLKMDYDYHHGNVTEVFELDYDSSTGILSGEVEFDFDRSTSWKFFFHHYKRHPKFSIKLAYSMDVAKSSWSSKCFPRAGRRSTDPVMNGLVRLSRAPRRWPRSPARSASPAVTGR
ncbi:MAG: hypothetical protein VW082_11925, partial [Candidatus Nanopelagicales bacterium]